MEHKSSLPDLKRQSLPERVVKKIGVDQLQKIETNLDFDKGQLQTIAQICKGKEKCAYGSECPLQDQPVNQRCPVEIYYQERWAQDYRTSYAIDQTNRQYDQMIVSLVAVDIELLRARQIIQKEGFEEVVVTESEDKKRIEKKLHSVIQLINTLEDRKLKLIKELKGMLQQEQTTQIFGDLASRLSKK